MLLSAARTEWGLNCECQAIQSLLPLATEEVGIISIGAAHKKMTYWWKAGKWDGKIQRIINRTG